MRKNYPAPPPAAAIRLGTEQTSPPPQVQQPETHTCIPTSSVTSSATENDETSIVGPVVESPSKPQSTMESFCCVCSVFANCITNICLPSCGIRRYQTRRFNENTEVAIDLINIFKENTDRIYSFIHLRLMPAIRPLLQLLYFHESQIEADGLTRISAQIWTATYLLQSLLKSGNSKTLTKTNLQPVQEAFMELVWEAEKAFLVDNEFYPIQQRFKKQILPEVWKLEDKYSGNRKEFVDPELRENLLVTRPFDGLYYRKDLKLKKKLQLIIVSKSSPNISNLSHEESKITFEELPTENKLNLILSLLNMSTSVISKIGLSLENHVNVLTEEIKFKDQTSLLKCVESIVIIRASLKTIWRDVALEWICDRLAEISGMTQLCYEYLKYSLNMDLPNYSLLAREAGISFLSRKRESSGQVFVAENNRKKSLRKEFHIVRSKLINPEPDQFESNSPGQKAEHPFTSESLKKVLDIETRFYCTEYHFLLQRIPLKIDNMRLFFK
ncbi:unnamed protein product [Allacma fusca]|uniref:Uncharacterized protein n=1 Tax=Allacma fusca TaxID=39272 RepID=A0A8J2NIW2_9HEXA|nr:unnamed protein product [Allacma fusca]